MFYQKSHCVSFKVYLKALALNAAVGSATRSCSQPLNGVCHRVFVMRSSKGLWGNGVDRTPLANGDAVLKANLSFPFFSKCSYINNMHVKKKLMNSLFQLTTCISLYQ